MEIFFAIHAGAKELIKNCSLHSQMSFNSFKVVFIESSLQKYFLKRHLIAFLRSLVFEKAQRINYTIMC